MKKLLNHFLGFAAIAILATQVISCKDDEDSSKAIASFSFEVDEADFKTIHFNNFSKNFSSVSWNFGDGTAASTEEDPSHTYAEAGTYTVVLTATGSGGTATFEDDVVVTDPNALLTALAGSTSKTWKMLRQVSNDGSGAFPLTVGELNVDQSIKGIWWRFGKDEDLAKRPCFLNDEFTFARAGLAFTRDLKSDFWAGDGGIYVSSVEFKCVDVGAANTNTNKDGADITTWHNPFTGTFVLTPGAPSTLKVVGNGAFIGLEKVASNAEVKVPQADVTYEIEKLYDAVNGTDTLKLMARYNFDGDSENDAYWRFVLVAYDNPANEPPLPAAKPVAGFTAVIAGNQLTTTNTTTGGVSYSWEFGDGTTSTATSPVHTYTNDGIYNVRLTATNTAGSNTTGYKLFVANAGTPALTDALLQGAVWKVQAEELSLFVGPAMGSYEWFVVPKVDLLTGSWLCLANDEFKFSAGGVYGYDTKGDVRDDGYFAGIDPNGCYTDAQLATSTNDGKKFRTFANHTYTFTAASGSDRAKIVVTDGAADAKAFIGFYKPFYGGENSNTANAANGGATSVQYEVIAYAKNATKEYLFVTCDISTAKDGTASWSFILVR